MRKLVVSADRDFVIPRKVVLKSAVLTLTRTNPLLEVAFRKELVPTQLLSNTVVCDTSDKIENLKALARHLQDLPETQKVKEVVRLVRSTLSFPYEEQKSLHNRFEELEQHFSASIQHELLSSFVEAGVGKCRHFADLFMVLGREAGLAVNVFHGYAKNFERPDTHAPLFKSVGLGDSLPHAWNEVSLCNGQWIPIDPTADFQGFETQNIPLFKKYYEGTDSLPYLLRLPHGWRRDEAASSIAEPVSRVILTFDTLPSESVEFNFGILDAKSLVSGLYVEVRA